MSTGKAVRFACIALILPCVALPAAGEEFTDAVRAYLRHRAEAEKKPGGIVIGIVDEHGGRIVGCGKLDDGSDQEVNGDTVFEIGSITKTFTGLLLQDMVDRGEMKLDDPLREYLPSSVKVPTHNGKEMTLRQLATHTSGLPTSSITWSPKSAENPRAEYTIEKMYDFLSGYTLSRDPGIKYEYSSVGMSLLGQAIALKAGKNYESLVLDRICRPVGMNSTRITLTPELRARCATGHNSFGYVVPSSYWGALDPAAGLRSTPSDLLKYLSANLGLTATSLTPLMKKTRVAQFHAHMDTDTGLDTDMGLAWMMTGDAKETVEHGGLTTGFISFVCFDAPRRRGVVLLSSYQDFDIAAIGMLLLNSDWQSHRRPRPTTSGSASCDPYVGQYGQTQMAGAPAGIGIRREGDRLFAQPTGPKPRPENAFMPPGAGELVPESEARFVERLSGTPMTFSRDGQGKVIGLIVQHKGRGIAYKKTSDQPPKAPEPLRPRVAVKLEARILDAVVGEYAFEPRTGLPTGMKLKIWREGDRLFGQAWGENVLQGVFDLYPESETTFFRKIDDAQFTFSRDDQAGISSVRYHRHGAKSPDLEGKKVKDGYSSPLGP